MTVFCPVTIEILITRFAPIHRKNPLMQAAAANMAIAQTHGAEVLRMRSRQACIACEGTGEQAVLVPGYDGEPDVGFEPCEVCS